MTLQVRLQEYIMQPRWQEELRSAISFFYGPEPAFDEDDEDRLFNLQRGIDYFIHDYRLHDNRRVIEHFSKEESRQLPSTLRALLKRWLDSRPAVYEVVDIRPGRLLLRDLLTQEEYWVHDAEMSKEVSPWDLILTRLFQSRDFVDTSGIGLHLPARFRDWIRSYAMDLWEDYRERHSEESYEDFLHASVQLLNQFVLGEVEEAMNEPPNLVTREGDPVEACQASFNVLDFAMALAALRGADEFKEAAAPGEDEKHFIWMEAGESIQLLREHGPEMDNSVPQTGGGERLLGHVWLDAQELQLETHSERRLRTGKDLLVRRCGSAIEHVEDNIQPLEEALEALSEKESEELPEEEAELGEVNVAQDMADWPDRPIPDLEGKTPREAVTTLGGRVRVIRLIKELQNLDTADAKERWAATWSELSRQLGLEERELRDEAKLEDEIAAGLDEIEDASNDGTPLVALERWHDFLRRYRVSRAGDLEFAEVWDLYELFDLTLFKLVGLLAADKEYDRAIQLAEELAEFAADEADKWQAEAEEIRIERGEASEALPRLVDLFERNLDDIDIIHTLADVQRYLLNLPADAVKTLSRALPEVADQLMRRDLMDEIIRILLDLTQFQEAIEFWHAQNDALESADRDYRSWVRIMLAQGELDGAREAATRIKNSRDRQYWTGYIAAQAGHYAAARKEWREELEDLPPEWQFMKERQARLLLQLHDPAAAIKVLRSEQPPGFREMFRLGLAEAMRGKIEQATGLIRAAKAEMERTSRVIYAASEIEEVRRLAKEIGLSPDVRESIGL